VVKKSTSSVNGMEDSHNYPPNHENLRSIKPIKEPGTHVNNITMKHYCANPHAIMDAGS